MNTELRYDVVVAGGGIAGTLAAVAASRHGAKVLIVEETGFLGGCLTTCGTGRRGILSTALVIHIP